MLEGEDRAVAPADVFVATKAEAGPFHDAAAQLVLLGGQACGVGDARIQDAIHGDGRGGGAGVSDVREDPACSAKPALHATARRALFYAGQRTRATKTVGQFDASAAIRVQRSVIPQHRQTKQASAQLGRFAVDEAKHLSAGCDQGVGDHHCVTARTHDDDGGKAHSLISSSGS